MRTKYWLESLKRRDHSEDLGSRRWKDNIKMDRRKIGFWGCGLDSCERGNEPSYSIKGGGLLDQQNAVSFSRAVRHRVSSFTDTVIQMEET
jgi:hypothetical protein